MARQAKKYWQVLRNVNWTQLSNGQMVGHPISPDNPTSDYKQGDVIVGPERIVSYISHATKEPKVVTGHFIQVSPNKYVPKNTVTIYRGGKPMAGKSSFSGADGDSKEGFDKGVFVSGIAGGLIGTSLGVILGAKSRVVAILAGSGVALGWFVGKSIK